MLVIYISRVNEKLLTGGMYMVVKLSECGRWKECFDKVMTELLRVTLKNISFHSFEMKPTGAFVIIYSKGWTNIESDMVQVYELGWYSSHG